MTPNLRQNQILNLLLQSSSLSAVEISTSMELGLRTLQRELTKIIKFKYVVANNNSKNTVYSITSNGKIYCTLAPELLAEERLELLPTRYFDFELFDQILDVDIFNEQEIMRLDHARDLFQQKRVKTNDTLWQKEIQRLIVEFSWKSSKIEGNTYTLLETEELLKNKNNPDIDLGKHTQLENDMILNHKSALDFIFENENHWKSITPALLLEIHKLLTNSLEIQNQFRSHGVGITACLYRPLDNQHQIKEVVDKLCHKLKYKQPFEQAILLSLLISYIQPFEDGNKRTSRTVTNAFLFSYNLPMISYRSTSVKDYKEAIMAFYEFGSIELFKAIFVEQVVYFSENYF